MQDIIMPVIRSGFDRMKPAITDRHYVNSTV